MRCPYCKSANVEQLNSVAMGALTSACSFGLRMAMSAIGVNTGSGVGDVQNGLGHALTEKDFECKSCGATFSVKR